MSTGRGIWRELNRQGHAVARCTVERLMRELGIAGAVRGKKVITTIPDQQADRAPDRVDRDFVAGAPNRCWAADLTRGHLDRRRLHRLRRGHLLPPRRQETQLVLDALETTLW